MFNVLIWGAGDAYNQIVNSIKLLEFKHEIEIKAIISKNQHIKCIDGYKHIDKTEISQYQYDYIIVAVNNFCEIVCEAERLGINTNVLIPYYAVKQPFFDINSYDKINKRKISVISQNCFGGILLNKLGMEFNSPFVNLWISPSDFGKMINELEYYLSSKVQFAREEYDVILERRYPVGRLNDIYIHFNHYSNFDEAVYIWNKRCARVNYSDIVVVCYSNNLNDLEKFVNCNYTKKLVFSSIKDCPINGVYYLRKESDNLGIDCNAFVNNEKPGFNPYKLLDGEIEERIEYM